MSYPYVIVGMVCTLIIFTHIHSRHTVTETRP